MRNLGLTLARTLLAHQQDRAGLYLLDVLARWHPMEAEIPCARLDWLMSRQQWEAALAVIEHLVALDAPAPAEKPAPAPEQEPVGAGMKPPHVAKAFNGLNALKSRQTRLAKVDYLRALCFLRNDQPWTAMEALKEELRYFPENQAAANLLADLSQRHLTAPSLGDDLFKQILPVIRPYTMLSECRLFSLYQLARQVCDEDLPGNFAECGVAAGGASALLAMVIARCSKRPRRLYCFDTFEGMPQAEAMDEHAGVPAEDTGWGAGTCAAPEASLWEVCKKLGVDHLVEPHKGLFAGTLPACRQQMGPLAFLHADGDWHSSTMDILTNLYDAVVHRGRIQMDDYGYWAGCKKAVHEFEQSRGLHFKLNVVDEISVWMIKE